jgi:hypothetical protein
MPGNGNVLARHINVARRGVPDYDQVTTEAAAEMRLSLPCSRPCRQDLASCTSAASARSTRPDSQTAWSKGRSVCSLGRAPQPWRPVGNTEDVGVWIRLHAFSSREPVLTSLEKRSGCRPARICHNRCVQRPRSRL